MVVDNAGNKNGSWGHGLTYNGRHVATVDGGTATHDSLGRWTQLMGAPGGQDFTADYNRFDLPTQVVRDGSTHTYRYDSGGSRVHRTTSGPGGLTSQTDFETAGGRFTKEVDASGTATWRVMVLGGNGPVVEVHIEAYDEAMKDKRFLHNDHLSSRTLETDSDGAVLAEHRTTPFGERLNAAGAPLGFGNALISGFGGHDQEASGFIDMGGRHYDPSIGRFLTVDPLNVQPLNPQSANGYAYVMNDPVTLRDPTGLSPCGGDFCDPPIGNIDNDYPGAGPGPGGGSIPYELEPRPSSGRSRLGGSRPPERQQIVDVQQARAPRADRRARGMSLSMIRAGFGMSLDQPFAVPSPREVAGDWDLHFANWVESWGGDDIAAGVGNGITFGLTDWFRGATGVDGTVDYDSGGYLGGSLFGAITSIPVHGLLLGKLFAAGSRAGPVFSALIADERGALTFGRAGTAYVNRYLRSDGTRHFSILVEMGQAAVHTHLRMAGKSRTLVEVVREGTTGFGQLVEVIEIALPNAAQAMQIQRELAAAGSIAGKAGKFSYETNSCLTHCRDIVDWGGRVVPFLDDVLAALRTL